MSKVTKWLIIFIILVVIAVLFRMGASIPAGVLSFVLFLAAFIERIMRINYMRKMYGGYDGGSGQGSSSGNMTKDEALEILELDKNASDDDIKKAYKKLIAKVHPDTGGSKYLTAKLNEARDVLLKGKK